jgi:hypothetical protein
MTNISINGITYEVPTAWEEITLQQFIEFMNMLSEGKPEYQLLYQIAAFCHADLEVLKVMNPKFLKVFLDAMEFLNSSPNTKAVHAFTHNGNEYSVMNHLLNSQTQDFISLMAVEKDFEKFPHRGIPRKIAILAKRKGETLDSYDVVEREKEFLDIPFPIAKGLETFFLSALVISTINSPIYLKGANEQIQESLKSSIDSLGKQDGLPWYGRWQAKMLQKYLQYIKQAWNNYYSTIISKHEKVK